MIDPFCHTSSIHVRVPAETAFRIMSDGVAQGRWAWGSFDRREVEPGLFVGTSVFDGKETFVRLVADPAKLTVDYEVGRSKDTMQFRNHSRVLPGALLGLDPKSCVVSLMSWRLASQSEAAWQQAGTVHEAEMYLIRGLLERENPA
ncbi:MAG: hypothetical protein KIT16_21760 [Rhodospirillaceae bacterium]|nr:hypothetical protein [Rhodospirillaceae bacterium]